VDAKISPVHIFSVMVHIKFPPSAITTGAGVVTGTLLGMGTGTLLGEGGGGRGGFGMLEPGLVGNIL
jgi:hypothetical protein